MRGLRSIPGADQLAAAYAELQSSRAPLAAGRLVELSQWSRFDPRLAEQAIDHVVKFWKSWNPGELREALALAAWPAALGVLLEHARLHPAIPASERRALGGMTSAILSGFPKGDGGTFFIGTRAFAGRQARQDAEFSSRPYSSWGFLGRDVLLNKSARIKRTIHPADQRRRILDDLVRDCELNGRVLTARDYRQALGNRVSPRLAELDLLAHPRLRPRGRTRARVYQVLARRSGTNRK